MPGLWTPWYVPMIPDADIVAMSGSVSNHWRRKSVALIVISWTKTACCFSGSFWKVRRRPVSGVKLAWVAAGQVGRDDAQDRLDEPGHLDHELAVLLVGLGVAQAPAPELADRPAVVVDPPQVVVLERRERAVEGQDVEAVLRQVELADDLGAEQADDVARDAEPEAREDLLGHRRAAEQVALLEDDGLQAGPGEVGGADEPVVTAADDDRVVAARPRAPPSCRALPGASVPAMQDAWDLCSLVGPRWRCRSGPALEAGFDRASHARSRVPSRSGLRLVRPTLEPEKERHMAEPRGSRSQGSCTAPRSTGPDPRSPTAGDRLVRWFERPMHGRGRADSHTRGPDWVCGVVTLARAVAIIERSSSSSHR